MALTVSRVTGVKDTVLGNKKLAVRNVTFDSSYATDGEALTARDFGFRTLDSVTVTGPARKTDNTSAVIASYDHVNGKLLAFWSAGSGAAPAQVTSATDLSTYSVRVLAIGTGTG